MPSRRINFTGRKTIAAKHVGIAIGETAKHPVFQVSQLVLAPYGLPSDASVWVEAYREATCMRFQLGTVSHLCLKELALAEFDTSDAIKFRVKVTSLSPPTIGQLLAVADRLTPEQDKHGTTALLPVKPEPGLGQQVFRLTFDDEPILHINDKIADWRDVVRSHRFTSLVYPQVLRLILDHILADDPLPDVDDSSDWRADWLRFVTSFPQMQPLPESDRDQALTHAWVEDAVTAFCLQHNIYDKFSHDWNQGSES